VPTLSSVPAEAGRPDAAGAVLDVAVPVHNEEAGLEPCVRRLLAHLRASLPYPFRITIADNASTDTTLDVARRLARELPEVTAVHLDAKGRGRALRAVWSAGRRSSRLPRGCRLA
jgi:glycosyltransferase involved in cell wall biosynthesis